MVPRWLDYPTACTMNQEKLTSSAPAHPNSAGDVVGPTRVSKGDKAGAQSEHQQFEGVRGDQGLVQGNSNAAAVQVRLDVAGACVVLLAHASHNFGAG